MHNLKIMRLRKSSIIRPARLIGLWVVCLLTACTLPAGAQFPTPTLPVISTAFSAEIPSQISSLVVPTETATLSPTETETPTESETEVPGETENSSEIVDIGVPTIEPPSDESTPLPTPTSLHKYPAPSILVESPGPLSKLVSPLVAQGSFSPGEDGNLYVELYGSDGSLVARQVINFQGMTFAKAYFNTSIPFDVKAAGEFARLVVSTRDKNQRTSAQVSVDVILLQMGSNIFNPPAVVEQPYIIQSPKPDDQIRGGVARIYGVFRPVNNNPLQIQITLPDGTILGPVPFLFEPMKSGQGYSVFVVEIPYFVSSGITGRLSIYQYSDNRIPGIVWLTSQKINLAP
jgi:hypothetical protein